MNKREELEKRASELGIRGNIARMKDSTLKNKIVKAEEELLAASEPESNDDAPGEEVTEEKLSEIIDSGAEIVGADKESQAALDGNILDEEANFFENSKNATMDLIGKIDKTDSNDLVSVAEDILKKHDIRPTLQNISGIIGAAARYPEDLKEEVLNVDFPTSYKHSGPGQLDIGALSVPGGESFYLTGEQLSDKRFMARFNHAYSIGTIVKV